MPGASGFEWEKHGRIFAPQDIGGRWWMQEFAQAPWALVFDDFVRVYFSCRPAPDARGQYVSYSAFVDLDRSDLKRVIAVADAPVLPLGKLGAFDEFGVYPVCVVRSGDNVLAYYGGWTRCESIPFTVSIGLATSHDNGRTFTRAGDGPLLTCNQLDPFVVSGPKVRRFGDSWHMWYVAGTRWQRHGGRVEAVYKIRHASSSDGIEWLRDGMDIISDVLDADECQASPDVFHMDGSYHMYFCYKHGVDFRNRERGYRIGYAYSRDLVAWTRDDERAGIGLSAEGWDSESMAYPHVFELDGQHHMLYIGNEVGRYGFGLATLRTCGA